MLDRLMQGCWLRGIRLSARAGEVVVDHAPPGALDESTVQALRSHGADVVRWLDAHPAYFRDRALTDNEQALWFLHRLEPQSCAYNIAYAARLKPSLLDEDLVPRLQRAWHDVQHRHPLLCSPFAERDGVPVQRGAPTQWLGLRQVELQAADPKALHQRLTDLADEPFDLASGDVSRLTLVCNRHAEGCDYILLLGIHHIAADGATIYQIIVDELISHLAGQPLAPVDAQAYRDFGSALYRRSEAEQASELAWWQARLQDAPALVLPTDFVTSDTPAHVGGDTSARFDETDTARIRALARSIGVTPYVLLLSLFQQYLGVLSADRFRAGHACRMATASRALAHAGLPGQSAGLALHPATDAIEHRLGALRGARGERDLAAPALPIRPPDAAIGAAARARPRPVPAHVHAEQGPLHALRGACRAPVRRAARRCPCAEPGDQRRRPAFPLPLAFQQGAVSAGHCRPLA